MLTTARCRSASGETSDLSQVVGHCVCLFFCLFSIIRSLHVGKYTLHLGQKVEIDETYLAHEFERPIECHLSDGHIYVRMPLVDIA